MSNAECRTPKDGATAPGGKDDRFSSPIYAKEWGDELVEAVRATARKYFRGFSVTPDDRITLYRLAALEAGGVVAEAWLADGVAAVKAAIAKDSIEKTHTSYLYGVLRDSCEKYNHTPIERLMGPLLLPDALKRLAERE
jgi:hypothetical protein